MNELLIVLLLSFPRGALHAHIEQIPVTTAAWVVNSALFHAVPVHVSLAVGVLESRLGLDTARAWGVPLATVRSLCRGNDRCTESPLHNQIEIGSQILRRGFDVCGSWEGSARRYQSGSCWNQAPRRSPRRRVYARLRRQYAFAVDYGRRVQALAQRLQRQFEAQHVDAEQLPRLSEGVR